MLPNEDNREMQAYTMDLVVNISYTAEFDKRMDEDEVYSIMQEQAREYLKNKEMYYFEALELDEGVNFRKGER